MADLHNLILIGPDGTRYSISKIDDAAKNPPPQLSEPDHIGKKIRALRKAKKWNQGELGRQAGGITQATISRIETGDTSDPHDGTVSQLLKALI